jgi:hypothetical protein
VEEVASVHVKLAPAATKVPLLPDEEAEEEVEEEEGNDSTTFAPPHPGRHTMDSVKPKAPEAPTAALSTAVDWGCT